MQFWKKHAAIIGDWQFFRKFANIEITKSNSYVDMHDMLPFDVVYLSACNTETYKE